MTGASSLSLSERLMLFALEAASNEGQPQRGIVYAIVADIVHRYEATGRMHPVLYNKLKEWLDDRDLFDDDDEDVDDGAIE